MVENNWNNQLSQILERLTKLEEKYAGLGQDMLSYLDGLYYSNGLTYWDYIHLDSLLGLQMPRTPFKDEMIFIVYHQMTELMFKLVKLELDSLSQNQGAKSEFLSLENWYKRLGRVNGYFRHLCDSFDIMQKGMDPEELRKFRMALLPASGFQSVQFRHIEIMSTPLSHLTPTDVLDEDFTSLEDIYPNVYWKRGGIDLETNRKTLTLREFEKRYDEELLQLIRRFQSRNLAYLYTQAAPELREDDKLREMMRDYDVYVNVHWKLAHLAAAAKHLRYGTSREAEGTGGTNWRSFLPPRFQRIIFFPFLWSEEEKEEWGKAAVNKHVSL